VVRKIGQLTSYPAAFNTLTITLASNVDLQSPARISVTGLGTLTGSITLRSIVGADGVGRADLFSLNAQDTDNLLLSFIATRKLVKGIQVHISL